MAMSRKDYVLLAETIAAFRDVISGQNASPSVVLDGLALALSDRLAAENPRFNSAIFLDVSAR